MGTFIRSLFLIGILAAVGGVVALFWNLENRLPPLSYNEFLLSLDNNEISEVHLQGGEVTLLNKAGRKFTTYTPDVASLMPKLLQKDVVVYGRPDRAPLLWSVASLVVPLLLILVVWFLLARKESQGESSDFAKRKAVIPVTGSRQVTFRDVAGIPEVKEELLEIVDFLQKPKKYSRLGAFIPKGILFQGPPGTGKTLLARAIAGEAGVPFYSISGSDFVEMFVGVGASRVRELFREAKKNTPCIIFIDEIDAVGGQRASGGAVGGQDERGQTLNALLVEMDGFSTDDTIIVLAATNRPDILDSALLRPRRFDRQITVLPPDVKGRQQILEVHSKQVRMTDAVDLEELARSTPGFTGADLASLVNEAALIAGRAEKDAIQPSDFEAAKDRILMGVERKGFVINEKERRTMALHESGHAILARFLPEADPLHKITIIPRGRAMGHTQQMPLHDRQVYSREYLLSRITILFGGRAAEEVVLNQKSTGAEDDLQQAMEIATSMVCRWGMDDVIGPMAYSKNDQGFLGNQAVRSNVSEFTAQAIDHQIKKILEHCHNEAFSILKREQPFLEHLADILLQTEMLDREEMDIIFECTKKKQRDAELNPVSGEISCRVV